MSKSGCLALIFGLGALAVLTGLCSFTSFSLSQQTVIDMNASGFRVDDPLITIRCALVGKCEDETLADAAQRAPLLVLTSLFTAVPSATPVPDTPVPRAEVAAEATAQPTLAAAATATVAPTQELPRITDPRAMNILLLGIDQRSAADEQGPFRTDTMILLNINPARETVGVLSFPRDLWVEIPSYGPGRINTANFLGDSDAYPGGGGPALAMETIAENFGIRVEKYLLVNFDVFTTVVDMLAPAGVLVNVTEFIDDPTYPDDFYGTIHVTFEPGEQRMDAETLLQYARTRRTQGGDFDRARRQQQVLDSVRAEVLSAGGIVNFVTQAFPLWQELQDNYRTNLELNEIIALGRLMGNIKREDIRYSVIDNFYASLGKTATGEDVLFPDFVAIRDLIMRTFYPQTQLTLAEIRARAESEAAQVFVYNGTSVAGLAGDTREWLLAQGLGVNGINNDVTRHRQQTEIRQYGRYNWTANYIAQLMGLPEDRIKRSADGVIADGVLIALGADAPAIIAG